MILNKTFYFWLIHKVDHYTSIFFFFFYCHRVSAYSGFICSVRFFSSVTRRRRKKEEEEEERKWMLIQCRKLRSKVKGSFVKLVNLLRQCRYIYIYIYTSHNGAFCHFIPSAILFSLQINKYCWFVFVWRCLLCLIFTIQYFSLWIYLWIFHHSVRCCIHLPSYHHIFELKSCYLSSLMVQRIQWTKLNLKSFVNIYQFIRYLSVVLKKNSSVKVLIYPFCL